MNERSFIVNHCARGRVDTTGAPFNFSGSRRQGSSVVEQGTHKPLVGSSTLPPGISSPVPYVIVLALVLCSIDHERIKMRM